MFCYQCQETKSNKGCTDAGVCGKTAYTADLQDKLLLESKKIAYILQNSITCDTFKKETTPFLRKALFVTVTNVNFDDDAINEYIQKAEGLISKYVTHHEINDINDRNLNNILKIDKKYEETDEDIKSLNALLINGLKGVAAYSEHAADLGYFDMNFDIFIRKALAYSLMKDKEKGALLDLVMECGKYSCDIMALLDKANTQTFGKQEPTSVSLSIKAGKSVLVSGHDIMDLYELLLQVEGKGINVYTHGEMLPAHAYPKLKKFKSFIGHFGTAWYNQRVELEDFTGPILFTTNCIQKPTESYKNRVFTSGTTGYPGAIHIEDRKNGQMKDFSPLIKCALESEPMVEKKGGALTIGFGKDAIMSVADKVIDAIKKGDITKFVVMAGCDGRMKSREYYTKIAEGLPKSAVILTAGCAKFRYNHLDLGNINGIPRLLDSGQCNDSYSIAYIALQLQKAFGLDDVNKLPVAFDIAWYEQKAVAVLLALLHLGFKNIRLGPTLPAFLSEGVAKILTESFGIKPVETVEEGLKTINA